MKTANQISIAQVAVEPVLLMVDGQAADSETVARVMSARPAIDVVNSLRSEQVWPSNVRNCPQS
jgi:hypothetical protein